MIEEWPLGYVVHAALRAVLGRRTVGLLFRPIPAATGNDIRMILKRAGLALLRQFSTVTTLAIVPVTLFPEIARVVDGWIYDFQLWDITEKDRALLKGLREGRNTTDQEAAAFYTRIQSAARTRAPLVSLGLQNRNKGFDRLVEEANGLTAAGWSIVVAGRVSDASATARAALATTDAFIEDRFVSSGELFAAYAAAKAVWCVYDPTYDQASGVLGRAVQIGLPVLVRQGSLSHRLCMMENLPHLAVGEHDLDRLSPNALPPADAAAGQVLATKFRARSLATLAQALGPVDVPRGNNR
ncbi:MAG: hypothetical protein ABF313_18355 [Marivita sp.]